MKCKAFSFAEIIVAVSISALIFSIALPSINHFLKFYKRTTYDNITSSNYRVISDISTLIDSTSLETDSTNLLGNKNLGFKILNTKGVYLNNVNYKSIKNYILPFNTFGDSLYIEIPYILSHNPLNLSNQFHLYRFVVTNSITKEQSLNYIPGLSEGSKTKGINFGKEEKLLKNVFNGQFMETKGGVVMEYQLENGATVKKKFIRTGEL